MRKKRARVVCGATDVVVPCRASGAASVMSRTFLMEAGCAGRRRPHPAVSLPPSGFGAGEWCLLDRYS